ncbi:MAG TPA: N-acetyltransferase [Nitrososphaerales archaeon]|nr:N-acetyltransferase [Nitrososphaerales archaeon]
MIRDCAIDDIPQVLGIENVSFDDPYPESLFISFLQRFPKGFRIAETIDRLVGYSVILPWKDRRMIITSLAVHPDFKRTKIATTLLEDAVSIARKNGMTQITLQVAMDNTAAQKLYSKFGFVGTSIIKNYYGKGRDGIEMELNRDRA